jgi:hypothetical protein
MFYKKSQMPKKAGRDVVQYSELKQGALRALWRRRRRRSTKYIQHVIVSPQGTRPIQKDVHGSRAQALGITKLEH